MAFERIIQTKYDASTAGFDKGTRRVEQNLKRLDRTAGSRLESIDRRFEKAARGAQRLGAAIAAFASVQGLRQLQRGIEGAVARLDNIAKVADKLGITTTALQELRIAAELSGVSAQTFDLAFQRFTRRSGEAAQGTGEAKAALKELGVTLDDLNSKNPEQLFNQVADAIARVENPSDRLRLAFKLFDSEGAALVNALTGGSAGLDQMRQKARDLGIVIEEDLIRRSVTAQDELTLIGKVIDSNVTVALANLGPTLVSLSEFFVTLSSVLPDSAEEMEAFASALKVTAVAAASVVGGRGISAVTAAIVEGTAARKAAVVESQRLVASTQAEVQSRRAALATLQRQIAQQAASEKGIKNLTAANKKLATARTALTTAEARAAAATNALTAAQTRLSLAARATTTAMTALRGAFAFIGGVPGLILAAASAAVYFATTLGDGAAQAEDLNTSVASLESAVADLETAQTAYKDAISATSGAQNAATSSIVADTKREFEAKKALLELEIKRQQAAQATRQAEIGQLSSELAGREGAASRVVRDPTGRVIETSERQSAARQARIEELRDSIKRLTAEAELADIALNKAEGALSTEFKDPGGGDGGGGGGGSTDGDSAGGGAAKSARAAAAATDELREARDLIVRTTERQMTAEEKLAAAQERIKALLPAIIELTGDRAKAEEIAAQAIEQAREDLLGPSPFEKLGDDIAGAIEQAQSFEEALNGVLLKIFEIAANDFFNSIFGNATSGIFGSLFGGGGSASATVAHTGGTIGQSPLPSRDVPAALFANAPRYHSGGVAGLRPGEVPAILERGEIVLPKNIGKARGGSNVVIGDTNLTITQPNMSQAQLEQVLADHRRKTIEAVVEMNERDPSILHT